MSKIDKVTKLLSFYVLPFVLDFTEFLYSYWSYVLMDATTG